MAFINGTQTKGRFKSRQLINFKVDYFKVYLKTNTFFSMKPKLLKLWLSANSDFYNLDEKTTLYYNPNLKNSTHNYYEIIDNETHKRLCFFIVTTSKKKTKIGAVELNSFCEVTGQGLILRPITYFIDLIRFFWYEIEKFNRVDIALDIAQKIDYIKDIIKEKIEIKTHEYIYKKWILETIYIGERNKKKNTYQLIRVYDKKRDTKAKNKSYLYPEYKDFENVTRIEIELRRDKAKFITLEKLLDLEYLYRIMVKEVYKYNRQYFKFIRYEDVEEIESKIILAKWLRSINDEIKEKNLMLYGKEYINADTEKKAKATFISYGKNLILNGYTEKELFYMLKHNGVFSNIELKEKRKKKETI